jgi:hypothetical protein
VLSFKICKKEEIWRKNKKKKERKNGKKKPSAFSIIAYRWKVLAKI